MTMDGDGVIEIPAYQQLMVPNALWPTMARVLRQHNLMPVRAPSLPGDQPVSLVEPVYAPTEVDGEGSNATGYEPGTYGCHEALHTTLLLCFGAAFIFSVALIIRRIALPDLEVGVLGEEADVCDSVNLAPPISGLI